MRVNICAVGRLRAGPERSLIDDYWARFGKTGRGLGLTAGDIREIDERKASTPDTQADHLRRSIADGSKIWVLDERGSPLSSPQFAKDIARIRDQGTATLTLCIGGADGFHDGFRDEADRAISFGAMVWPHMLARVMLTEQLYRAAGILAGTPYHRD